MTPAMVLFADACTLAMPKSVSFTLPSKVTMMLCGEMSLWMSRSARPSASVALCA